MRTSEVLNTAADLIEVRGWGQGSGTWSGDRGLCVEGALAAALGRPFAAERSLISASIALNECPVGQAVRAHIGSRAASNWLCSWNDQPERTAAEVIEVLRAAALVEHAKEQAGEQVSA